jgi:hypothetical protein
MKNINLLRHAEAERGGAGRAEDETSPAGSAVTKAPTHSSATVAVLTLKADDSFKT